ncbi:hypothetical protein M1N58_03440 [Dehalococcoidales bacterium]|nr:hypothetical protein [Dehalococcoidales bacterium]MCL0094924.1 hypothetical protein [Dehalococcoidales bacterium]
MPIKGVNVMEFHKTKKLTIITEAVILDSVLETATKLGAAGYTIHRAAGRGERGARAEIGPLRSLLENVRIEIITSEQIAKKIAVEVVEKFFKNYAGIVYLGDVEVIQDKLL